MRKTVLKSSLTLSATLLILSVSPAQATVHENGQPIETEQTIEKIAPTPAVKPLQPEISSDGWQKLAENHMEAVYFKPPPKSEPANAVGIEVKVVAQEKDLFDYAEGVAMADCSTRTLFPVSGEIYDIKGQTVDPMHIPLMKGMAYVTAFPQDAYDALTDQLCEGEPIPEAY